MRALAKRYAGEAAISIRWLRAQSIRLIRGGAAAANLGVLSPPVPRRPGLHWEGRAGDVMLRQLTANLEQLGGMLHRGVRARELVVEGAHCVGVVATQGDETQRWRGSAVVIADGGFQANPDLVRQHISKSPEKLLQRNAGTARGDGLLMAQAIGAGVTDLQNFYGHVQSRDAMHNATLWPYPTMDFPVAAGIAVDERAERFTDEGLAGVAIANAIARLDNPLGATAIFDQAIWEASGKTYVMSANPFLIEAGGTMLRADTITVVGRSRRTAARCARANRRGLQPRRRNKRFQQTQTATFAGPSPPLGLATDAHPPATICCCPVVRGTHLYYGRTHDRSAGARLAHARPSNHRPVRGGRNDRRTGGWSLRRLYGRPREGFGLRPNSRSKRSRPLQAEVALKIGAMDPTTNNYPAIHFLVRHGHALAIAVAIVIGLGGIAAAVVGWGWAWIPAGFVLAALAYLLFRSYAEIVQVIAETLLPR